MRLMPTSVLGVRGERRMRLSFTERGANFQATYIRLVQSVYNHKHAKYNPREMQRDHTIT